MPETESSGTSKGSLKDRLRFFNILMQIARKKKLRVKFNDINNERLSNINRMYLFFLTPAKIVLDDKLNADNTILYDGMITNSDYNLVRTSNEDTIDLILITKTRKKKGIDIKEEISKKYNVEKEKISDDLVNDYVEINSNSKELFGVEVPDDIKKSLIIDRIKADKDVTKIREIAELEKDLILGKDIDYDLKQDAKSSEKLAKTLEKEKKVIERILRDINKYTEVTEKTHDLMDVFSLVGRTIGIGVGLLTLPFSASRSLVLGTNLIRRSLNRISGLFRRDKPLNKKIHYEISLTDIETATKSLKSSDFLLEDILDKLDHLKYKIKIYEYKIPEVSKKIKEIEVLEQGLVKKKRELTKMIESLEKSKIKVLNRENNKH